jgi:hypothetical protein
MKGNFMMGEYELEAGSWRTGKSWSMSLAPQIPDLLAAPHEFA